MVMRNTSYKLPPLLNLLHVTHFSKADYSLRQSKQHLDRGAEKFQ